MLTLVDPHARIKSRSKRSMKYARTACFLSNRARCYCAVCGLVNQSRSSSMKELDKKKCSCKTKVFVLSLMKSEACSPTTVNYASHITLHASMEFYPQGHSGFLLYCRAMQPVFAAAQLRPEHRNVLWQHVTEELLIPWVKYQKVFISGVRCTRSKHWQAGYCLIPLQNRECLQQIYLIPHLLVTKAEHKLVHFKSSDVQTGDKRIRSMAVKIHRDRA